LFLHLYSKQKQLPKLDLQIIQPMKDAEDVVAAVPDLGLRVEDSGMIGLFFVIAGSQKCK
jgi:hypothetical protein